MNQELLYKAAAYCSSSEHCITEVRDKLLTWGAENNEVQPIIEYLQNEKYIDEYRYAHAYMRDKVRFAKWGKQKINYMLHAKHVDKDAIQEALNEIDEDEYLTMLTDLLRAKKRTLHDSDNNILRQKLFRYAASRGFDISDITKALREL